MNYSWILFTISTGGQLPHLVIVATLKHCLHEISDSKVGRSWTDRFIVYEATFRAVERINNCDTVLAEGMTTLQHMRHTTITIHL